MAWETRGDNKYYYSKQRIAGKVISRYMGSGQIVEEMVLKEQERQKTREKERRGAEAIEQQVLEVGQLAKNITEGILLISGFHKYKGQWRKKRHANR